MGRIRELQNEAHYRRCARDELFFLQTYFKIRVPGRGRIPFELRDAQLETLKVWNNERYTITLKARQIGFSTLVAAHAVWLCLFHPDQAIVMLSKTERDAQKLLLKAKFGYRHLPNWLKERAAELVDDNLQRMTFRNGSVLESLPSASDPARGEAVDLVVVDEWAFLPNAEDAWASIEPITDIGGRVIGISTANGAGNFFHNFYVAAKTGNSAFKAIFYAWTAASERDSAWYESKKRSMLEWQLHQEYPQNDTECFIKSGHMVFDYDGLQELPIEEPRRGYLQGESEKTSKFIEGGDGPLRVWQLPERGISYVLGADVAEGLEHGDYSTIHVCNTKTGQVVAMWKGHVPADLFGSDIIWRLGWFYGCALAGVEVNNHGLTTLTHLRDKGYPNIYYRYTYDERTKKMGSKIGWRTQKNTKPLMIDELAGAIRGDDDSERQFILACADTKAEMETYVRDASGAMHGSPFDDLVVSAAICNQMRKHSFTPQYADKRDDYGTWNYWSRMIDEDTRRAQPRLGSNQTRTRTSLGFFADR